jgi:hypothetical protein
MKRRKLLKGILALTLADYVAALHSVWASEKNLPPAGVQHLRGEVKINGEAARLGMLIQPGDRISTSSQSEVIYVIGQDAYLQRDHSTVSINAENLKNGLRVLSGKLMAVFGKGEKQIETTTATIGIRGTGCYIEAEADKVYFCLCYGKAEVAAHKMPEKTEYIETTYHDNPVYLYADAAQMMEPADAINHTDNELILLENLVGRLPPFYGKKGLKAKY